VIFLNDLCLIGKLKFQKMTFTINPLACPQNHLCPIIRVCQVGAISQNGYGLPLIDETLCIDCGKCVKQCPMRAVENIH
jgi:ferredoxin